MPGEPEFFTPGGLGHLGCLLSRAVRAKGGHGMDVQEAMTVVLDTMKAAGEPLNAGKIAERSGLDRKLVDKAMAALKKSGAIVSPVRCKWEPAE
jgi:hypothetical protein